MHKHKNRIKIILHTNFKYDTFEMQKKTTVMNAENITDITIWMRPLQWMFKVSASATSVDASLQKLVMGLKAPPMKT